MSLCLGCCAAPAKHGEQSEKLKASNRRQEAEVSRAKEGHAEPSTDASGATTETPAQINVAPVGLSFAAARCANPQDGRESDAETDVSTVQSSRSSLASEFINERIPARQRSASRIKDAMKKFVRSMVRGRQMSVVSPDGQLRMCSCSLDKRLQTLIIEVKGSSRRIPLKSVGEVCQGKEPEDIDTPLDDLCSTLMLESGECISFNFPNEELREQFAMCLQILVDGQQ